ncbi:MAG TPA: A24 family peptidase [Rhodopila sp.]|nr:A24 family peptidase [Rhodopila sp.]
MIALFLPVLAAPFVGSLLGVLIARLPAGRPVAMARSHCETCHRTLAPVDLVPLLSYMALRGRCRTCRAPIGRQHLAVELAAIVVALWALTMDADPARLWIDCSLGWTLLALAWIDWRHFRLPDVLTLPLLLLGLAVTWLEAPDDTTDHAIGALAGYLGFCALAWAYRSLRGRDGLGLGDAKLLAVAGAWLGWMQLPHVILIAAVCGIVVALTAAVRRGRIDGAAMIPFGPCLAFSIWIIRLYDRNGDWASLYL